MTAADRLPPPDWRPPARSYVVTGTARSGSSYLCELLASTGALGDPIEYFNRENVRRRDPSLATASIHDLLRYAGRSAGTNGVVGIKLFADQFDACARSVDLLRWFPGARFVHLERRDMLGQAISHVRAIQTGHWKSRSGAPPAEIRPIAFDGDSIALHLREIALANARWATWFAATGIEPLRLVYEDVVAAPAAAVAAVARHVGLDRPVAPDLARLTLQVQRDGETEAWRRRFVAAFGDLARLPDLAPAPAVPEPEPAPAPGRLEWIVARLRGGMARR